MLILSVICCIILCVNRQISSLQLVKQNCEGRSLLRIMIPTFYHYVSNFFWTIYWWIHTISAMYLQCQERFIDICKYTFVENTNFVLESRVWTPLVIILLSVCLLKCQQPDWSVHVQYFTVLHSPYCTITFQY